METLIMLIIGLTILMGIMSYGKAKLPKAKQPKLPAWVKFNYKRPWNIEFFDRHAWVKAILIRLLKGVIWIILYLKVALSLLLAFTFAFARKATLPK